MRRGRTLRASHRALIDAGHPVRRRARAPWWQQAAERLTRADVSAVTSRPARCCFSRAGDGSGVSARRRAATSDASLSEPVREVPADGHGSQPGDRSRSCRWSSRSAMAGSCRSCPGHALAGCFVMSCSPGCLVAVALAAAVGRESTLWSARWRSLPRCVRSWMLRSVVVAARLELTRRSPISRSLRSAGSPVVESSVVIEITASCLSGVSIDGDVGFGAADALSEFWRGSRRRWQPGSSAA